METYTIHILYLDAADNEVFEAQKLTVAAGESVRYNPPAPPEGMHCVGSWTEGENFSALSDLWIESVEQDRRVVFYYFPADLFAVVYRWETLGGEVLQKEQLTAAAAGAPFSATAAVLDGYHCTGHRVDGAFASGSTVELKELSWSTVLIFLYVEGPEVINTMVTREYRDQDGGQVLPDNVYLKDSNSLLIERAPAVIGYVYLGLRVDGGELREEDVLTIPDLDRDIAIRFEYWRDDGSGENGSGCCEDCCSVALTVQGRTIREVMEIAGGCAPHTAEHK